MNLDLSLTKNIYKNEIPEKKIFGITLTYKDKIESKARYIFNEIDKLDHLDHVMVKKGGGGNSTVVSISVNL